jgi:hypothetical protein
MSQARRRLPAPPENPEIATASAGVLDIADQLIELVWINSEVSADKQDEQAADPDGEPTAGERSQRYG